MIDLANPSTPENTSLHFSWSNTALQQCACHTPRLPLLELVYLPNCTVASFRVAHLDSYCFHVRRSQLTAVSGIGRAGSLRLTAMTAAFLMITSASSARVRPSVPYN